MAGVPDPPDDNGLQKDQPRHPESAHTDPTLISSRLRSVAVLLMQ
jgi:hypothetical protein